VNDYGESDKLVTFYSPDIGKATGIAKGAKRSKQRFVNKLEEFSLLQIIYRPARQDGLLFLSEAELTNAFLPLRRNYKCYVAAMLTGELVLKLTRERDPDPFIFSLLIWAMRALEKGRDPLRIAALFHLKILGAAGYQLGLDRCGCCKIPVKPDHDYTLHPASGMLVCNRCRRDMPGSMFSLSVQTLKFLHNAQRLDLHHLGRLHLTSQAVNETLFILYRYTQHLLQQDINSWLQIKALLSTKPAK